MTEQLTVQAGADGVDGDETGSDDDGAGPGFGIANVVAGASAVGYLLRRRIPARSVDQNDE
ncbi:MAG: PGF-CTERM archaeal protein-sorting signal [halophilic archaeon J07HX5]|jgi:hypothetical protein|nr:MAG: PGF-CTERM archaeal protein-sorting signal [halophilic archaeon J07HX5]